MAPVPGWPAARPAGLSEVGERGKEVALKIWRARGQSTSDCLRIDVMRLRELFIGAIVIEESARAGDKKETNGGSVQCSMARCLRNTPTDALENVEMHSRRRHPISSQPGKARLQRG